jgi:uncharacterized protein YbjT (DUF2867 family)
VTATAVTGASGKTGRAVGAALRAQGERVVEVGRAGWRDLAASIAGTDRLYVIAPNMHPDEPGLVTAAVHAARTAGVPRIVYHSVASPYAPAMPHHVAKARAEDVVRRSGLAWTILQPCAYLQNFLPLLTPEADRIEVPYDVQQPFGLVDLADVAEAAAAVLLDGTHVGATYELGGPALVSVADIASAASALLGRRVAAVRVDPAGWAAHHPQPDLTTRDWLLAMFGYYDAHGLPAGPLPLRALLGRDPHSLQDVLARELGSEGVGSVDAQVPSP